MIPIGLRPSQTNITTPMENLARVARARREDMVDMEVVMAITMSPSLSMYTTLALVMEAGMGMVIGKVSEF